MRVGDDVLINGIDTNIDGLAVVPAADLVDIAIRTYQGTDRIVLKDLGIITGGISIDSGSADDVVQFATENDTTFVNGAVSVDTGSGADDISFSTSGTVKSLRINGDVTIASGSGNDRVEWRSIF